MNSKCLRVVSCSYHQLDNRITKTVHCQITTIFEVEEVTCSLMDGCFGVPFADSASIFAFVAGVVWLSSPGRFDIVIVLLLVANIRQSNRDSSRSVSSLSYHQAEVLSSENLFDSNRMHDRETSGFLRSELLLR